MVAIENAGVNMQKLRRSGQSKRPHNTIARKASPLFLSSSSSFAGFIVHRSVLSLLSGSFS